MIRGAVNARHEAVLDLRIRGSSGIEVAVTAVIDTGSTASLTLPHATVAALGLTYRATNPALLANGVLHSCDMYDAEVEWDGVWLAILVTEVDSDPLLGTRLLAGHELYVEFNPGGVVEVRALP